MYYPTVTHYEGYLNYGRAIEQGSHLQTLDTQNLIIEVESIAGAPTYLRLITAATTVNTLLPS